MSGLLFGGHGGERVSQTPEESLGAFKGDLARVYKSTTECGVVEMFLFLERFPVSGRAKLGCRHAPRRGLTGSAPR
jgi:hypothetical protein